MEEMFESLRVLSEKSRFRLVRTLLRRDLCVEALSKRMEISESAVSQHLKVLQEHGLVDSEKRGYYKHYRVRRDYLQAIGHAILSLSEIEPDTQNCCHEKGHHGKGKTSHDSEDCCKDKDNESPKEHSDSECCKGHE